MDSPSAIPVTLATLREAHARIAPHVKRTPVLTNARLDELSGARVFVKCENLQLIGAFKARGATNAIFSMAEAEGAGGVLAHSSGNHAQAVALAARLRGWPACIVMPQSTPAIKLAGVRALGAEVVLCGDHPDDRPRVAAQIQAERGWPLIHPYDDWRVIAGQGTATLELFDEVGPLDAVLAPVSGGGLLSGTALAATALHPACRVYGCEPANADDTARSFAAGVRQRLGPGNTICDGLRAHIGEKTFAVLQRHCAGITTHTEEEIIRAMRFVWDNLKVICEPSCSPPVAALLDHKVDLRCRRVGVILSGGNVDLDRLPWIR